MGHASRAGKLDGFSIALGHEIEETVTDPGAEDIHGSGTSTTNLGGWYDAIDANENGDKCAWVGESLGAPGEPTVTPISGVRHLHRIVTGLPVGAPIIESMSYVELHFHLLPGIDDGPSSLDESLALAAAAVRDGTRTVVATPHVHAAHVTDPSEISARVRELRDCLGRERIHLDVLPGGELAHDMVARLESPEIEAIAQGPAGRRWVLLEAPFAGLDADFTEAGDELRERGFAVVVAHPERASPTLATPVALEHELAAGSALQLTAWSCAGLYGERARSTALRLLQSAPRAVIASDAHGGARTPALGLALGALSAAGVGSPYRFASAIPRGLLEHGLARRPATLVA